MEGKSSRDGEAAIGHRARGEDSAEQGHPFPHPGQTVPGLASMGGTLPWDARAIGHLQAQVAVVLVDVDGDCGAG
jgi:hypothetical protein